MDYEKAAKYMEVARAVAKFSKDQSTKVGAVILGPAYEVRSLGYNGAPRGCRADEDARGTTRPEKYFWMEHAERNAIYNAARAGVALNDGVCVVTHPPCIDCARALVQVGVKAVIWPKPEARFAARWAEHADRVMQLFSETHVASITI